jgi:RNA polymerase sigma factor (sigma-70 family)
LGRKSQQKPLTPEQSELMGKHYKLIFKAAKNWFMKSELNFDDCYDSAIDAAIYTASIFDESKGFKFSTMYYSMVQKTMLRKMRDNNAKKRSGNKLLVSIEEPIHSSDGESITLGDLFGSDDKYTFIDLDEIGNVWHVLKDNEKNYIYRSFILDVDRHKIAAEYGYTKESVDRTIRKGLKRMRVELEKQAM